MSISRRRRLGFAALLALITALTFSRVVSAGFLSYDDYDHVAANQLFHPTTAAHLAYFWRYPFAPQPPADIRPDQGLSVPPYKVLYGPLAFTVWGGLATLSQATQGGLNPHLFHAFDLLLHVVNTLLVFALLCYLVRSDWAAAGGALLFGLHPVQVETVAWVTAMNTLLCTGLGLVALLLYLRAVPRPQETASAAPAKLNRGLYALASLAFALAVLAKPYACVVPAFALLLLWGLQDADLWRRFREMALWAAFAAGDVVINLRLRGDSLDSPELKVLAPLRLLLEGDSFFFYLGKVLWPLRLSPDYGRQPHWVLANWWGYVTWTVPVAFTVFLVLRSRASGPNRTRWRLALAGWGLFFVTLVQTSGITPFYFHTVSLVSDRYMYFAMLGPALWVALLLMPRNGPVPEEARSERSPSNPVLAGVLLVSAGWAVLSFNQTKVWNNDTSLWLQALQVNPRGAPAARILGGILRSRGQNQAASELFRTALGYSPGDVQLLVDQGDLLSAEARPHDALTYYSRAVAADPKYAYPHLQMGRIYAALGDLSGAAHQFEAGLKLAPDDAGLLGEVGILTGRLHHPDEAALYLQHALANGFDAYRGHLNLGIALAQQGELALAIPQWHAAIAANPTAAEPHLDLGLALEKLGQWQASSRELDRAQALGSPLPAVQAVRDRVAPHLTGNPR